jgi:acetyltransferase-like isoleucine patch superfamily enzyme
MTWLARDELCGYGYASIGENVLISPLARIHGAHNIHIGGHVRIDDFALISAGEGGVNISNYVHIAPYAFMVGHPAIRLDDYSGLSWRAGVLSSTEDFSGLYMTNPTVPSTCRNPKHARVHLQRHVVVGAGSLILPGVILAEGAAIGTMSLVTKDCEPFRVYVGIPARPLKNRTRRLLELERLIMEETGAEHE